MNNWPLYCGTYNLARFLAIHELLTSTLDIPGHVAEFGSFKGTNAVFLTKMLQIYDPLGSKLVYSFDSFEGLRNFDEKDGVAAQERGCFAGDLAHLEQVIDLFSLQGLIQIVKRDIEETLPQLLTSDGSLSFSFVYMDVDLYAPTKVALEGIHDRLSVGGCIVFDEWAFPQYPGETTAVREFMTKFGHMYEAKHVARARQPTLWLRKLGASG